MVFNADPPPEVTPEEVSPLLSTIPYRAMALQRLYEQDGSEAGSSTVATPHFQVRTAQENGPPRWAFDPAWGSSSDLA